jgi:glycosyltransferase involved in cell wall biosynthesis
LVATVSDHTQPELDSTQRDSTQLDSSALDLLGGKHLLVVGINYAPEPTGIAPYTTGTAEHLAARAASVTVLTGLPHYPAWRVDERYLGRRRLIEPPARSGEPTVVRLSHHVPSRQTALTRARYEATFLANALTTRLPRRPDLVLAATPSLGGAVASARIAQRYDVPLVVVVQDLMAKAAGKSGINGGGKVAALTARLERYALRQASTVAVVSDAFRSTVRGYGVHDDRIALLPNWTHITPAVDDRATARRALGWPQRAFIVAHTGNIGLKQDLGSVIETARLLPGEAEFVLVGDGSQRPAVQAQAAGLPNVRFVDPLDDAHYPLALAAADVLLVNERATVGDMSLPSKLTSYLSAGRPVLAAVDSDGATAAELDHAAGAGLVVPPGEPYLLAAAVRRLRSDDALRAAMSRAGLDYAQHRLGKASSMLILDEIINAVLAR